METVLTIAVVVLIVVLWVAWICSLASVTRTPSRIWNGVGRGKGITFVLVLITGGIGGIYYWVRVRPELLSERRAPTSPDDRTLTAGQRRAAEAYLSKRQWK